MQSQETIYIIGAGAIGKALAAFLTHEGRDVILLRGSIENAPSYQQNITVESKGNSITETVRVSSISAFARLDGIIVLTSKSFGNTRLARLLKTKVNLSPIIILQNGLHIEQAFLDEGFLAVYRCVLFATGQPASADTIIFKPVSPSPIGIVKGDQSTLIHIVERLSTSQFEFRAEPDIQPIIWTKVILNSIFNSVCPLLEVDNGIFHRNAEVLNIATRIISECIPIAECMGVFLSTQNVLDTLIQISRASDGQLISTYQDILNKQQTEISTLNAAIVKIANNFGMENSVTETTLLGELVHIKAELALSK